MTKLIINKYPRELYGKITEIINLAVNEYVEYDMQELWSGHGMLP